MKTIVFASQKGGSSKSMLTRCQAVAAELAGDGPVAMIDTEVGKHADFILIPVKASPDDIDAIPDTLDMVQPLGKPFGFVLTQVKSQALITGQAKLNVSQFGLMSPVIMADRVDYPGAVSDGQTVLETDPTSRSAGEMMELWDYLKDQVNGATKAKKAKAA